MLQAQVVLQNRIKAHSEEVRDSKFFHPMTGTFVSVRTLQLIEQCKMLMGEAAEAHDETPWKMHKTEYGREMTQEEFNACAAELIDALHFVINGLILCGYDTSSAVRDAFFAKNVVNHQRQDQGY